jgi:hypothetical protein
MKMHEKAKKIKSAVCGLATLIGVALGSPKANAQAYQIEASTPNYQIETSTPDYQVETSTPAIESKSVVESYHTRHNNFSNFSSFFFGASNYKNEKVNGQGGMLEYIGDAQSEDLRDEDGACSLYIGWRSGSEYSVSEKKDISNNESHLAAVPIFKIGNIETGIGFNLEMVERTINDDYTDPNAILPWFPDYQVINEEVLKGLAFEFRNKGGLPFKFLYKDASGKGYLELNPSNNNSLFICLQEKTPLDIKVQTTQIEIPIFPSVDFGADEYAPFKLAYFYRERLQKESGSTRNYSGIDVYGNQYDLTDGNYSVYNELRTSSSGIELNYYCLMLRFQKDKIRRQLEGIVNEYDEDKIYCGLGSRF